MALELNFREHQHAVFFHDVRVFIFGVEVTPWLTGQVTINICDRNGPNQASFILSNPADAFVVTKENLAWDATNERRTALEAKLVQLQAQLTQVTAAANKQAAATKKPVAKSSTDAPGLEKNIEEIQKTLNTLSLGDPNNGIWRMSKQQNFIETGVYTDLHYSEQAKHDIFYKKLELNKDGSGNFFVDPLTLNPIYPLSPRSLVFHKHDTVRIFGLYPYDEPGRVSAETFDEKWIPLFTGFVDQKPRSVNAINGESSISLSCTSV